MIWDHSDGKYSLKDKQHMPTAGFALGHPVTRLLGMNPVLGALYVSGKPGYNLGQPWSVGEKTRLAIRCRWRKCRLRSQTGVEVEGFSQWMCTSPQKISNRVPGLD